MAKIKKKKKKKENYMCQVLMKNEFSYTFGGNVK